MKFEKLFDEQSLRPTTRLWWFEVADSLSRLELCPVYPEFKTHWGRVTHISVGKLTNIGSDNGLSPGRRQAIIWTNTGILLIGPLGTNFSEILIEIQTFSLKKIRLKMSSAKCCSFRLGLNVLTHCHWCQHVALRNLINIDSINHWRVFTFCAKDFGNNNLFQI